VAIQKAVRVMTWAVADGVSTSFSFNLNISPYWVGTSGPTSVAGAIVNWFGGASSSSKFPPPTGVVAIAGADSATLDSPVVTVNVPVQPAGSRHEVILDLLFD
jgi:hypothetical protein